MAPSGVMTLLEVVKKGIPDIFVKRKLNFITVHYIYIGCLSFLGSAIFYGIGSIDYIDALFFSSGACTQSGLNTVDINLLRTGQQIMLYIQAMLCNPIVINTSVVFIRLYWFEKRFKDVVREARQLRRTKSRGRQRRGSMLSEDAESGRPETSVRGRAIQLLRNTGHRAEGRPVEHGHAPDPEKEEHIESSDTSQDHHETTDQQSLKRRSSVNSANEMRLPEQMNHEQHIQFVQKQRFPEDNTTLRIPSPREFERGGRVQSVDENTEGLGRQMTRLEPGESSPEVTGAPRVAHHITFNEPDAPPHPRHVVRNTTFPRVDTGKASTMDVNTYDNDPMLHNRSRSRRGSFLRTNTGRTMEPAPYLSWQPTVARNSFFVNLTEEQREELGGIEYRALKTLAVVLLGYFFFFHLIGLVCLVPWIYKSSNYGSEVTSVGQGRAWWGIFTAQSAFNDLGFTLTPNSMIPFQSATFPMLLMTFLIIIGNTGFPCMLRFVIWALSKCVPVGGGLWEELQFLLDHPRRCFTLLFPRAATWWLFAILVLLNTLDLLFFITLDLNADTVETLHPWVKFLVGLFQAASTRTAGFAAVNLADLHPGVQVSYLIMMYISVFPIAISMRRTNVYEEKSLGIYANPEDENDDSDPSYVGAHLRKQLSFDLWYVFLGLFIITISEGHRIGDNTDYAFDIFSILFEIISAYGTVGLSLGYPTSNTSFSGQFNVVSKLVIIAMQIRGRHRGLPYELDRAILLPSESLHRKEAQEAEKLLQRRRTDLSRHDTRNPTSQETPNGPLASSTSYKSDHGRENLGDHRHEEQMMPRQRRLTNKSVASLTGSNGEKSSRFPFAKGLGNNTFKVAGTEQAIKEEREQSTSRSD